MIGAVRRLQAPLLLGGGVLLAHAIVQLWPWITQLYEAVWWWLWLGVAGVLLVVAGGDLRTAAPPGSRGRAHDRRAAVRVRLRRRGLGDIRHMRSTHAARHSGAGNGCDQYAVSLAILPSRNSKTNTVWYSAPSP